MIDPAIFVRMLRDHD
ncbi:hypothetical protein TCAP_05579, partial [Tolypocladium capitatum]